jgi:hypothetical protein
MEAAAATVDSECRWPGSSRAATHCVINSEAKSMPSSPRERARQEDSFVEEDHKNAPQHTPSSSRSPPATKVGQTSGSSFPPSRCPSEGSLPDRRKGLDCLKQPTVTKSADEELEAYRRWMTQSFDMEVYTTKRRSFMDKFKRLLFGRTPVMEDNMFLEDCDYICQSCRMRRASEGMDENIIDMF